MVTNSRTPIKLIRVLFYASLLGGEREKKLLTSQRPEISPKSLNAHFHGQWLVSEVDKHYVYTTSARY